MSFDHVIVALAQLEREQPTYEDHGGHGIHLFVLRLGRKMCTTIRRFAEIAESFTGHFPADTYEIIVNLFEDYRKLMRRQKNSFWKIIPCLHIVGRQLLHTTKCAAIEKRILSIIYSCELILIEHATSLLNEDHLHYKNYSNAIFKIQGPIQSALRHGTQEELINCRLVLLAAIDAISLFMRFFENDTEPFWFESKSRMINITELLGTPEEVTWPVIIEAQDGLFKVISVAALIPMNKSLSVLSELKSLQNDLRAAYHAKALSYDSAEANMHFILFQLQLDEPDHVYIAPQRNLKKVVDDWQQISDASFLGESPSMRSLSNSPRVRAKFERPNVRFNTSNLITRSVSIGSIPTRRCPKDLTAAFEAYNKGF
jgi:hypothetical protein